MSVKRDSEVFDVAGAGHVLPVQSDGTVRIVPVEDIEDGVRLRAVNSHAPALAPSAELLCRCVQGTCNYFLSQRLGHNGCVVCVPAHNSAFGNRHVSRVNVEERR